MKILLIECHGGAVENPVQTQHLHANGHVIHVVESEEEALASVATGWPEMILVDAQMDNADAHTLTRKVKSLCARRLMPVVFLSSILDDAHLASFIESYADDFIEQPHNPHALKARIAVLERSTQIHDSLQKFKQKTNMEIGLAKQVFDALISRRPTNISNVQHWNWAAGHFSGDVLLYEYTPQGALHLLLGDFAGHGLSAAVGALPASETFFSMTRKGLEIGVIAEEINEKLFRSMPTGHFCAACLVSFDSQQDLVEVWNGGLPPVLIVDQVFQVAGMVRSSKLALGVLPPQLFDRATECLAFPPSSLLVMYSDGLTEAVNPDGEMFGHDRLGMAIRGSNPATHIFDSIKSSLISFIDGLEPLDDVSLVTLSAM
ncbi:MAG: SpoIIE family protein phosphatase [Sulfuricella sp.]